VYHGHRVKVTGVKSASVYPIRRWSAFDCKALLLMIILIDIAFRFDVRTSAKANSLQHRQFYS